MNMFDDMTSDDGKEEKVSFSEAKYFLTTRIMSSVLIGGLSGVSAGHYIGDSMMRLGPAWSIGGGVLGFQFFGGALALRAIRGKDDIRNYAISGSLTSMSTLKYLEFVGVFRKSGAGKGLVAGVAGLLGGIFYHLGANFVYSGTRQYWLENRRHLKHISPPRQAPSLPKRPLSRELIGKVPPLQEGMSFEPEEPPTKK